MSSRSGRGGRKMEVLDEAIGDWNTETVSEAVVGRRGVGRREQDTDGGMGTYDIYFRNDVYDQMGDKKGT